MTVRQIVDWRGHTSSLADEREYLGLPPLGDRAVELLAIPWTLATHVHTDGCAGRNGSRDPSRLMNPLYRYVTWQELFARAGAISRALR